MREEGFCVAKCILSVMKTTRRGTLNRLNDHSYYVPFISNEMHHFATSSFTSYQMLANRGTQLNFYQESISYSLALHSLLFGILTPETV